MTDTARSFDRFFEIVRRLRSPGGCPWDREQTAESLAPYLLEEALECIDEIRNRNDAGTREELGDVLLIAAMIGYVKEQGGAFSMQEVFGEIAEKLVRRHPHVFGDSRADSSEEVKTQWDSIKQNEKGNAHEREHHSSALSRVSRSLPPLERAYRLQKKAAKVGFDWGNASQVVEKIAEELDEVRHELDGRQPGSQARGAKNTTAQPGTASSESAASAPPSNDAAGSATSREESSAELSEEIGDLLFSVVNLARFLGLNPSVLLDSANEKFIRRFRSVEADMKDRGIPMRPETMKSMDAAWDRSKRKGHS